MSHIRNAYDTWAKTHDNEATPTRDLARHVLCEYKDLFRHGSVLECGCATGKTTALLAEVADDVQALDFLAAMLERARGVPDSSSV